MDLKPSGRIVLSGEMVPALAGATPLSSGRRGAIELAQPLTLTVTLRRSDQGGFDRYLSQVTNPASPRYGRYLSTRKLTARFGPSEAAYDHVLAWLQSEGFTLVQGSADRLTLSVRGTRELAQQVFATPIRDFRVEGRRVYANTVPPSVPRPVAGAVAGISGLSNLATPTPLSTVTRPSTGIGPSSSPRIGHKIAPAKVRRLTHAFIAAEEGSQQLRIATTTIARAVAAAQKGSPTRLDSLVGTPDWSRVGSEVKRLAQAQGIRGSLPALSALGSIPPSSTQTPLGQPSPQGKFCIKVGSCVYWTGNSECLKNLLANFSISQFTPGYAMPFILATIALFLEIEVSLLATPVAIAGAVGAAWAIYGCVSLAITWNGKYLFHHSASSSATRHGASRNLLAQKIGLLEFDGFHESDVTDWMSLMDLQSPNLSNQLTVVPVNGGVGTLGSGESEVLLDIDTSLALNPNADYAVYEAPLGTSFEQILNAMIQGHVSVIGNSWAQCEDQTAPSEANAIDSVLAQAEGEGISVFNASGDSGSTCLDGSPNTVTVPADSPHAIAVGGATPVFGKALSYAGERWWGAVKDDPPSGQGGFGVSRYFPRPTYQNGLTQASGRSVPDLAINADPRYGLEHCQADNGGCPDGLLGGGTSMAAPEMAAMTTLMNQAIGSDTHIELPTLYKLESSRPAAFHSPAEMQTDFQHVGLGSPDFNQWALQFTGTSIGPVSASASIAEGGAGTAGEGAAVVRVNLLSDSRQPVGGKAVTLKPLGKTTAHISAPSGLSSAVDGSVTFLVTDPTVETVKFSVVDTSDNVTLTSQPSAVFLPPPAASGSIGATLESVPADGTTSTTLTVTLLDDKGKPAIDKNVTIDEGAGHAIITPTGSTPGVSDSNGQATFSVVNLTAETDTFTATDVTDGDLAVPGSATVVFTSGSGSNQCPPQTVTAVKGYKISTFASGFFDGNINAVTGCGGVGEMGWSSSNEAYVPDYITGDIYKFNLAGGSPNGLAKVTQKPYGPYMAALAFGKNGDLYADQWFDIQGGSDCCGFIYQLDPTNGSIIRVVAEHVPATNIFVDPVSGDIMTTSSFNGGPDYSNDIYRIHDAGPGKPPADCAASPPVNCSVFADIGGPTSNITFDKDGTLYVGGAWWENSNLWQVTGTASKTPGTVTQLDSTLNAGAGPTVITPGSAGKLPVLAITQSNEADTLDLNQKPLTPVQVIAGPVGDQDVGPDGCLYVSNSNSILKLTTAKGTCPYTPVGSLGVGLSLAQSITEGVTGGAVTFTAHLSGVAKPAGRQVMFSVLGANSQLKLLRLDAQGNAVLTYTGIHSGFDTVFVTTRAGGKIVTSGTLFIRWKAGRDVTATSLVLNQQSASAGQRVPFTASLTDQTASPPAPLAGKAIDISVAGRSCKSLTGSGGGASCELVLPNKPGEVVVTARYSGSAKYLSSSESAVFTVKAAGPPLIVSLGYAAGRSRNFPNPWLGSKGVRFIGVGAPKHETWDTSGILLVNHSLKAVRVDGITVDFPATRYHLSPWGSFTVPVGGEVILSSTDKANAGNFDGSENAVSRGKCDVIAKIDAPVIRLSIHGGKTWTFVDSGHVLDAGGHNPSNCHENESETWRFPGALGGPFK